MADIAAQPQVQTNIPANEPSEKQGLVEPSSANIEHSSATSSTPLSKSEDTPISSIANLKIAESEPGNTKNVPFAFPAPNCAPALRPALTEDQQKKYDDLLAHVSAIESLPVSQDKNAVTEPLADHERMWLTKECLLRYLRATKWVLADAKKRVEGSIIWRREYGVEKITADYIEIENRTGKLAIMGYDNNGRPCLHMNPARQNTEKSERQVQETVWFLERVIDVAPLGQETVALLIDYKSSSSSKNPGIGQGKQVLNILQTHYPERLGRALIVNIPWFVWGFFKLITPFIDPVTREKLKFNEDMKLHIPSSQLLTDFGGDISFEYNHEVYWPALVALSQERRKIREARWRQNGSRIGESEEYLKAQDNDGNPNNTSSTNNNALNAVTEGVANVSVA